MLIDFHSHVLPGMDDGAKDLATSLMMLGEMQRQGIALVMATSHFYLIENSIAEFLDRRNTAYRHLMAGADASGAVIPPVRLGAEVHLTKGLSAEPDLAKLCLEGTRCLLLELPFASWPGWVVDAVGEIRSRGISPILAHVERQAGYPGNEDLIARLLAMDLAVQINAESILSREEQRFCLKLIKNGVTVVLGSDTHNLSSRPPRLKEAAGVIRKKLGDSYLQAIEQAGQRLLQLA